MDQDRRVRSQPCIGMNLGPFRSVKRLDQVRVASIGRRAWKGLSGDGLGRRVGWHPAVNSNEVPARNALCIIGRKDRGKMPRETFSALLDEARKSYGANSDLVAFAPFPDDLEAQEFTSSQLVGCDLLRGDQTLGSQTHSSLQNAIRDASPDMHWRDTYKQGSAGTEFMDRWGCFSIIGDKAPFISAKMRLFVLYMAPGVVYPWHRHPAEEIYLVVSGRATFRRQGARGEELSEGRCIYHSSNQVHALETTDSGILCLVAWRNHLTTLPVLTPAP